MCEALEALLATGIRIATAVREQRAVPMPMTGDSTDAEAGPFKLTSFAMHFVTIDETGVGHVTYGYQRPNGDGAIDPNAQFHLQQLLGELLAFNLYCQRAEHDGALGVALQVPEVAPRIDSMLVKLAFFAGLFDNMVAQPAGGIISDEMLDGLRVSLERRMQIVQDKLLDRSALEANVPPVEWPFVGVEIAFAPHEGDYFINNVYFPAEHAKVLLAAQQMANGGPAAGANAVA